SCPLSCDPYPCSCWLLGCRFRHIQAVALVQLLLLGALFRGLAVLLEFLVIWLAHRSSRQGNCHVRRLQDVTAGCGAHTEGRSQAVGRKVRGSVTPRPTLTYRDVKAAGRRDAGGAGPSAAPRETQRHRAAGALIAQRREEASVRKSS